MFPEKQDSHSLAHAHSTQLNFTRSLCKRHRQPPPLNEPCVRFLLCRRSYCLARVTLCAVICGTAFNVITQRLLITVTAEMLQSNCVHIHALHFLGLRTIAVRTLLWCEGFKQPCLFLKLKLVYLSTNYKNSAKMQAMCRSYYRFSDFVEQSDILQ